MTDAPNDVHTDKTVDLPDQTEQADILANRFTMSALERHKREGLHLAITARWIALTVVAIMLPFLNPHLDVLFYEAILLALAVNGWIARKVGRVGLSRLELVVMFVDLTLITLAMTLPNPLNPNDWPQAMTYRLSGFQYMFILLASGTLAYSWRTIMALGTWATVLWLIGLTAVWWVSVPDPALTNALIAAFPDDPEMAAVLDPNNLMLELRIQEVVVFLIVALTLAITVRRFNRLLLGNAALERERENLSRYFSPNMVDELAQHDEPLKQIRTHDVAVLFVDIIGFTAYAADRPPQEVIETLRGFHARMETEVFNSGGTLDKFLGDGLMATFGTPMAGKQDATNALRCTRAMTKALADWNRTRAAQGETRIKASFGLHYGPVVLGDIGAHRLEFAVIGNTVNVASRVESLTRTLDCEIAITDDLHAQVIAETDISEPALTGFSRQVPQPIRGLDNPMLIWTL